MDKPKRPRKRRPTIISHHGRYRFQTGMITAQLLERGLSTDAAFATSQALRDRILDRKTVTTDELQQLLDKVLAERGLGPLPAPGAMDPEGSSLMVRTESGVRPFDRSLLLRDLFSAGIYLEPAMEVAQELTRQLSERYAAEIDEGRVEREVSLLVERRFGASHARRYRLTRWLRRADKPVIIMIGGSTGTGKSTLAQDLAFRLGIRLTSHTDMIREVMRTVLSPEVVPGLHDHSFRGIVQGGQVVSDPRERVLAGFRQQAAQVAVGIRAVIRRALQEHAHLVIEGTHILPPFEQYLPPSAEVYFAGLVLAVPEEGRHLERFPTRAKRETLRDPKAYLDSFQAVRWIHDDLLQIAEDTDAVVIGTEGSTDATTLAVEYLSRVLPVSSSRSVQTQPGAEPALRAPLVRTLFLVVDGLGDVPNPALDGRTPLAAAHTPFLDMLAAQGGLGRVVTSREEGGIPETNEGLALLLGGPEDLPMGRGLVEALGQGVPLTPGAVLFRGNLASVASDGALIDRRAGRIRAGAPDLLADLKRVPLPGGIFGSAWSGAEHRLVVMLTGSDLSEAVSDTDPGSDAGVQRSLPPRATDDSPEAERTAEALAAFLAHARTHLSHHPLNQERRRRGQLPADAILTRGAARVVGPATEPMRPGMAMVASCPTALGIARARGIACSSGPGMTGSLDTDLRAKFQAAARLLQENSLVIVHVKGTDIAAHDRRALAKRDFIEEIDKALGQLLSRPESIGLRVVVSSDHGTSSISGHHIGDPVPLLLATWTGPCEHETFDEESAERGALGLLGPGDLTALLASG